MNLWNLLNLPSVRDSMFALKSDLKLENIQNTKLNPEKISDKLLVIYKKLKNIAKSEINSKNKFKLANLKADQINQINSIEFNMGLCFVAYELDSELLNNKIQILTQINKLLNDYSKLITKDDFSKFFE